MEQFPQEEEEPTSASSSSSSSSLTVKLHELLGESDTEEGNSDGKLCFQEEVVEGMMQDFYREIAPFSSSTPSPSNKVIINQGDNGSCGASVSDKGSSVMAGIAGAGGFPVTENGSSAVLGFEGVGSDDGLLEFGAVGNDEENINIINDNNEIKY